MLLFCSVLPIDISNFKIVIAAFLFGVTVSRKTRSENPGFGILLQKVLPYFIESNTLNIDTLYMKYFIKAISTLCYSNLILAWEQALKA